MTLRGRQPQCVVGIVSTDEVAMNDGWSRSELLIRSIRRPLATESAHE